MTEPIKETTINPEILKGRYVVVVDDDEPVAKFTKRVFERKGALVQTAINGKEALTVIEERKPALIVTDNSMPEMTGPELIKKLREDPETAQIPIILTSGDLYAGLTPQEIQGKAVSLGANAGIAKPCIDISAPTRLAEKLLSSPAAIDK